MRLLVTGGAGFIGSNFIHYWLQNHPGDFVVNLDKLTYAGNLENLTACENNPNYSFVKGDICDPQIVRQAMANVDIVVHFAAESHVDRSIMDPSVFVKSNVLGTQVLLNEALDANVRRFHHISTDEVFGALELDDKQRFTEETPYSPRSPYSASKAAADHLVRAYHVTYKLPITITNCADNFGPFQYPEKLISLSVTNVLEGKKVPIYGDGLYVRDWLYVEDHCRAIDLVIAKGKVGETYLVGTDSDMANIDLVKKLLSIMGKDEKMIDYVKDRPGHDRRYAIDSAKIKNELGWKPVVDLEEALKKTVAWYKSNKKWWQRLRNKSYMDYYNKQYVER